MLAVWSFHEGLASGTMALIVIVVIVFVVDLWRERRWWPAGRRDEEVFLTILWLLAGGDQTFSSLAQGLAQQRLEVSAEVLEDWLLTLEDGGFVELFSGGQLVEENDEYPYSLTAVGRELVGEASSPVKTAN